MFTSPRQEVERDPPAFDHPDIDPVSAALHHDLRVGHARRRGQAVAYSVASVALLLLLWQLISWYVGASVLPGPWASIYAVKYSQQDGYLWSDIAITLYRMAGAFVIAFVASVLLGTLLGTSRVAGRLFGSWVTIGASIPALVSVVVVYLAVGINDRAAMIGTALVVAPTMTFNVWDGVRAIDPELREMARAFGVDRWRIVRHVVLPQTGPFIFTAARAGWALTWRIMIFVELVGRPSGVGYRIQYWYNLVNMRRAIAAALPFCVLMLLVEYGVLRPVERRLLRWRRVEMR